MNAVDNTPPPTIPAAPVPGGRWAHVGLMRRCAVYEGGRQIGRVENPALARLLVFGPEVVAAAAALLDSLGGPHAQVSAAAAALRSAVARTKGVDR